MKRTARKLFATLLAAALAFSLFGSMPASASMEGSIFLVTEQPEGATYILGEDAAPVRATFELRAPLNASLYSDMPILVTWYWDNNNSNTSRTNVLEQHSVPYGRAITHTTTVKPATDAVGVKYYFAVISYGESRYIDGSWKHEPAEIACTPARIEVIAPPQREREQRLTVNKVDEDGRPLAGAIIRIQGYAGDGSLRSYESVSDSSGAATFSLESGDYQIFEYAAPEGYNATDVSYDINVSPNGISLRNGPDSYVPYSAVTFVNKTIPQLNKIPHNFAYMQGYPDGTFRPANSMTRAEAVVMFSRLLMERMNEEEDFRYNCYPDVDYRNPSMNQPWYANQVCFMHKKGVLADFSRDGYFRPDEPVTRAEFATLAAHFEDLTLTDTNIFSDVPNNHWAVKYINSAAARGWIAGYEDGTFRPETIIRRQEVVTLVNRILDRAGDSSFLTANAATRPRTYTDVDTGHWAYLNIMEASIGHTYTRVLGEEKWTAYSP